MPYLVRIDTPRVKKYVFATNRLKEIRGASTILDNLNNNTTRQLVRDYGGAEYYIAGGGGLIEFQSEDDIESFRQSLEAAYFEKTDELFPQIVHLKDDQTFQLAHKELLTKLASSPIRNPPTIISHPITERCHSCHSYPVAFEKKYKGNEKERRLCAVCAKKSFLEEKKQSNKATRYPFIAQLQKFYEQPNLELSNLKQPDDFMQIGSFSSKNGYVGLIYADGNNMGRAVQKLFNGDGAAVKESRGEIKKEYKQFSEGLKKALEDSVNQALYDAHPGGIKVGKELYFASEILFLGGDDILVVCPADKALLIAKSIAENFESNKNMKTHGLSLGVGVLLSQANLPINTMIEQVEQLMNSAKQRSYWQKVKKDESEGGIDFGVVTASSARKLSEVRKDEWILKDGTRLTARPYSLKETAKILKWGKQLKQEKISVGRLSQLEAACRVSKAQGNLAWYSLLGRMKPKHRQVMTEMMRDFGATRNDQLLWIQRTDEVESYDYTMILDILEIYPYLEG